MITANVIDFCLLVTFGQMFLTAVNLHRQICLQITMIVTDKAPYFSAEYSQKAVFMVN